MLTFRQAQVAALAAFGASNKEIANILGVAEATIKTYKKQLRQIQKENNIDFWGLPLDRAGRNKAFAKVLRGVVTKYKFGGKNETTDSNSAAVGKVAEERKRNAHTDLRNLSMQQQDRHSGSESAGSRR